MIDILNHYVSPFLSGSHHAIGSPWTGDEKQGAPRDVAGSRRAR